MLVSSNQSLTFHIPESQNSGLEAPVLCIAVDHGSPGDGVPVRHLAEYPARLIKEPALGVHVREVARDEELSVEAKPDADAVQLRAGARGGECGRGARGAGERELRGGDMRAAHGGEGGERVVVHGVLDETRDERRPGDEVGAGHDAEHADGGGRVGAVGVHGDEVVGEEGGRGSCAGEQEARMEGAAAADVTGAAARLEERGEAEGGGGGRRA